MPYKQSVITDYYSRSTHVRVKPSQGELIKAQTFYSPPRKGSGDATTSGPTDGYKGVRHFKLLQLERNYRSSHILSYIVKGFLISPIKEKFKIIHDWVINGFPEGAGLVHSYYGRTHHISSDKGGEYFDMAIYHTATGFPQREIPIINPIFNRVESEDVSDTTSESTSLSSEDVGECDSPTEPSSVRDGDCHPKKSKSLSLDQYRGLKKTTKLTYTRAYVLNEPRLDLEFEHHWVANDDSIDLVVNGSIEFSCSRTQLPKPFNGSLFIPTGNRPQPSKRSRASLISRTDVMEIRCRQATARKVRAYTDEQYKLVPSNVLEKIRTFGKRQSLSQLKERTLSLFNRTSVI